MEHFGGEPHEGMCTEHALRNAGLTELLFSYNSRMTIRKAETKLLPCHMPVTALCNFEFHSLVSHCDETAR